MSPALPENTKYFIILCSYDVVTRVIIRKSNLIKSLFHKGPGLSLGSSPIFLMTQAACSVPLCVPTASPTTHPSIFTVDVPKTANFLHVLLYTKWRKEPCSISFPPL